MTYLSRINENINRTVDHQHEMVPPREVVCPPGPGLDCTEVNHLRVNFSCQRHLCNPFHLNCFVYIERKSGGVAEEEDNHDGKEQGSHGGVPAMALGDAVVDQGGPDLN